MKVILGNIIMFFYWIDKKKLLIKIWLKLILRKVKMKM